MLILQWVTTTAAIVLALAAFVRVRALTRRLERMSESYWELRYEHGQLRSRLAQLEQPGATESASPAPAVSAQTAFVPLSSLKR
ncbi:MAG TPA: hypothetical protein VH701_23615 [Vicinamibacterales bacterium]